MKFQYIASSTFNLDNNKRYIYINADKIPGVTLAFKNPDEVLFDSSDVALNTKERLFIEGLGNPEIVKIDEGPDSTVIFVREEDLKSTEFFKVFGLDSQENEARNGLVLIKIYGKLQNRLASEFGEKKAAEMTESRLNKYFKFSDFVRQKLEEENYNFSKQRVKIPSLNKKYTLKYKLASSGSLVKINDVWGSIVYDWVPGDNLSEIGNSDFENKIQWSAYDFTKKLSLRLQHGMSNHPCNFKYKIDHENETVWVLITDILPGFNNIPDNISWEENKISSLCKKLRELVEECLKF